MTIITPIALASIYLLFSQSRSEFCSDDISYQYQPSLDEDRKLIHKTLAHMKNKHVMFIGDSLSRFHYFAFVYALKYLKFMENSINPNPTFRHNYTSDFNFFDETNKMFSPSHCDCYRSPLQWQHFQIENRYYYNLKRQFNITYYIYYGHDKLQGHWADNGDSDEYRRVRKDSLKPFWSYHIEEFFDSLASSYQRKPTTLIFNVGIHVPNEAKWRDVAYLQKVCAACTKKVPNVIFRTTTWSRLDHIEINKSLPFKHEFRDQFMCNSPNIKCMNVSWTQCIPNDKFIDDFHFQPEIYNRMARQLMFQIIQDHKPEMLDQSQPVPFVYYINLDRRKDRRELIEAELARMNLQGKRFSAVDIEAPSSPNSKCIDDNRCRTSLACTQSHVQLLRLARNLSLPYIIILEDDFQFLSSTQHFRSVIESLPQDYDVVMLCYNLLKHEVYNSMFGRALEAQTSAGYIVNQKYYDVLIKRLQEGCVFQEQTLQSGLYTIDQYWKALQLNDRWYYCLERVGRQRKDYSDIELRVVDYGVRD